MRIAAVFCCCLALAACNTLWAGSPTRTKDIGVGIHSALPPPEVAETSLVGFSCDDGSKFSVNFDNKANTANVTDGGTSVVLPIAMTGSGFRYADATHELRGKGDDAMWTAGGKTRHCTAKS